MPSRGSKRGRKGYVTHAFSGVPRQTGTKSQLDASPLPSRGPKRGRKCYATHAFSGVPKQMGMKLEFTASALPSWGPKRGRKCYVTPAFSGVPKQTGTKSELAASPLPSRGPKIGRKCYVTPAFSGGPNKGTQSEVKTYARGNNDAPSTPRYGSLVRLDAQTVALSAPPNSTQLAGQCKAELHQAVAHRYQFTPLDTQFTPVNTAVAQKLAVFVKFTHFRANLLFG